MVFPEAATARRGVPFYSAVPPGSAAGRVVASLCRRAGAPLLVEGRDWRIARARTSLGPAGPETRFDLASRGGAALDGLVVELDGQFSAAYVETDGGKGYTVTTHQPTAHPRCRCSLALRYT